MNFLIPKQIKQKTMIANHNEKNLPSMPPLRVLIVDDHAFFRGGLEAMLARAPGIESIAMAVDGHAALELCESFAPDVILLDLRMPVMDGHSALEVLSRDWPQIRVIVLSGSHSAAEIKLAQRNGAAGFISKSENPASLMSIIQKIAAGGSHFPSFLHASAYPDEAKLSVRELEVLQYLARGLSNEDIATALGVSGETIKSHLKHSFSKLGVTSRAEAVSRAHELGLV
jgi:DNA-binding NarL/FixJ family response regulator